jgi:hypothetical protein
MEQLDANLKALEVSLSNEQIAKLDEASHVRQAFPFDFVEGTRTVIQHGSTVNGISRDPWPLGAQSDDERW